MKRTADTVARALDSLIGEVDESRRADLIEAARLLRETGAEWSTVPWTEFKRAEIPDAPPEIADDYVVLNSRYQVNLRQWTDEDIGRVLELSIKALDKSARHDWRDLQRIKNELIGPEYDAVEMYPSEDRLVDTANQYFLWVPVDLQPLPFGFRTRLVSEVPGGNARQRPWSDDTRPTDLKTADELEQATAKHFADARRRKQS